MYGLRLRLPITAQQDRQSRLHHVTDRVMVVTRGPVKKPEQLLWQQRCIVENPDDPPQFRQGQRAGFAPAADNTDNFAFLQRHQYAGTVSRQAFYIFGAVIKQATQPHGQRDLHDFFDTHCRKTPA